MSWRSGTNGGLSLNRVSPPKYGKRQGVKILRWANRLITGVEQDPSSESIPHRRLKISQPSEVLCSRRCGVRVIDSRIAIELVVNVRDGDIARIGLFTEITVGVPVSMLKSRPSHQISSKYIVAFALNMLVL